MVFLILFPVIDHGGHAVCVGREFELIIVLEE